MNRLIIHTATRVIMGLTSDDDYQATSYQSFVTVTDKYELQGESKKLDADDVTQVDATAQEISDVKDSVQPKRVKLRELSAFIDNIVSDNTIPSKIRNFVSKLKEVFN